MLLDKNILKDLCESLRNQNKTIVFTNGCFDILHTGHINYLSESKKLGDILIIGLNTDSSVKRLKGESRPINNQIDRAIVLSSLKSVDYVCLFDEETPIDLITNFSPNILTKGGDYKAEDIVGYDFVTQNGGKVLVINFTEGKSTTKIIEKMKS